MEQWKEVLAGVFGRRSKKRWIMVAFDIMCVDAGLKKTYLFDQWSCSKEEAHSLLANLHKQRLINNKIGILSVCWNTLIFSVQSYQFPKVNVESLIVDISLSVEQPMILNEVPAQYLLTDETFQDFCHFVNQRNEEDSLISISIPEYEIEDPGMANAGALFGLALGYPFIYWSNGEEADGSGLSMHQLRVYEVKGQPRKDIGHVVRGNGCHNTKSFLKNVEVVDVLKSEAEQCQEAKDSFPPDLLEQKEDALTFSSKGHRDAYFDCQNHAKSQMNASCENEKLSQRGVGLRGGRVGHTIFQFTLPECCHTQTARDHVENWFSVWRSSVPWCSLFSDVWMEEELQQPQALCL